MTNSKLVPRRRFKEFDSDGEWEQNQLKELAEFSKGRGYSKSELQTDGQPIILYGRLYTKYETVISTVDTFTHIKENSVLSKGGEVLVPSSGESAEDIARASVVAEEGIIIGGDLNIIKLCKKIEPIFLSLAISNGKQKEEISKRAQGKSVVHVNNDDLKQVNVLFPSISEQIQIGKFFQTIDSLLSIHQHKLDKLKNLKKAYLSEMFPAEGERVPKRRFPGFEGEWEIKKLKELTEYRRGSFPQPYGKSEWYGGSGSMPFVQVVDVLSNLKLAETTKQQISKLAQNHSVFVPQGTVVITLQGSIGRVAITQYDSYVDRTLLIFEKFLFPTDIYYWALSIQQKFDIESKKAPGGTIKTITKEALSEFEIFLPTLDEQKQIGSFFHQLDKSISLQQQKLDKLNDLKKAYLNELFV